MIRKIMGRILSYWWFMGYIIGLSLGWNEINFLKYFAILSTLSIIILIICMEVATDMIKQLRGEEK